jgi:hypothetical protein
MHLDWTALGEVAAVSVGVTVAVVVVFALAYGIHLIVPQFPQFH